MLQGNLVSLQKLYVSAILRLYPLLLIKTDIQMDG